MAVEPQKRRRGINVLIDIAYDDGSGVFVDECYTLYLDQYPPHHGDTDRESVGLLLRDLAFKLDREARGLPA